MTFSIKKSFQESWKMFFSKKIYMPFVLANLVAVLGLFLIFGASGLAGTFLIMRGLWWLLAIVALVFLFISAYFILVTAYLPLDTYQHGQVNFKKVFTSMWDWKLILKLIGMFALIGIAIFVGGFLLASIVGKINPVVGAVLILFWIGLITVRFGFSLYVLIETKGGIISSLKKSNSLIKGNGWKFFAIIISITLFYVILQLLNNMLMMAPLPVSEVVSNLITILFTPWFSILVVSPYMQIKG